MKEYKAFLWLIGLCLLSACYTGFVDRTEKSLTDSTSSWQYYWEKKVPLDEKHKLDFNRQCIYHFSKLKREADAAILQVDLATVEKVSDEVDKFYQTVIKIDPFFNLDTELCLLDGCIRIREFVVESQDYHIIVNSYIQVGKGDHFKAIETIKGYTGRSELKQRAEGKIVRLSLKKIFEQILALDAAEKRVKQAEWIKKLIVLSSDYGVDLSLFQNETVYANSFSNYMDLLGEVRKNCINALEQKAVKLFTSNAFLDAKKIIGIALSISDLQFRNGLETLRSEVVEKGKVYFLDKYQLAIQAEKYEEAVDFSRKLKLLDPENGDYSQMEKEAKGRKRVKNGNYHFEKGNEFLEKHQLKEAIAEFKRAHSLLPSSSEVSERLRYAKDLYGRTIVDKAKIMLNKGECINSFLALEEAETWLASPGMVAALKTKAKGCAIKTVNVVIDYESNRKFTPDQEVSLVRAFKQSIRACIEKNRNLGRFIKFRIGKVNSNYRVSSTSNSTDYTVVISITELNYKQINDSVGKQFNYCSSTMPYKVISQIGPIYVMDYKFEPVTKYFHKAEADIKFSTFIIDEKNKTDFENISDEIYISWSDEEWRSKTPVKYLRLCPCNMKASLERTKFLSEKPFLKSVSFPGAWDLLGASFEHKLNKKAPKLGERIVKLISEDITYASPSKRKPWYR